ncbi:MAG TPA: GNAT family N-acetyltransferase [Pyrinomonadaceae bacterium]|nr:GNAT family N-acetyltransferase [Pyrinomonadaceae bacterium]
MSLDLLQHEVTAETPFLPASDVTVMTDQLMEDEREEVLAFLQENPLRTVAMAGFIRDNGFRSGYNRGIFWGCRNSEGELEGVALIGHVTLIEARTQRAVRELALVAQVSARKHMILGEREQVAAFWAAYADSGQPLRRACRERLFELRHAVAVTKEVEGLRRATPADIDLIAPVHAAMAEEESGVNPLNTDPEGFVGRCLRRIKAGRVWVNIEDGRLLFKADVQADTPNVVYLEGVWVAPSERNTGFGRRCVTQLSRDLLLRTKSVCLLVNEENERAHNFYRRCGFRYEGVYDTIFLQRDCRS